MCANKAAFMSKYVPNVRDTPNFFPGCEIVNPKLEEQLSGIFLM